jgi:hypothetical protein
MREFIQRRIITLRTIATCVVASCMLWLAPAAALGFTVQGRVVNGTTERSIGGATVTVVNPSGGMAIERELETNADGRFSVDGLSTQAPIYLLRVTYEGIHYNSMVRFDGTDPYELEVLVYDKTDSWDSVHVSVPHMMVGRVADTLTVNKLIQITNHSSPPKTVYGDAARYLLYIPPDALSINTVSVQSLGVPLPVTPTPTDEPGFYTLDYPIKPGATSVQLQYDLPYASASYHYSEPLKHDLAQLLVITQDPTIQVTSSTLDIGSPEDFHGFKAFELTDLSSGDTIDLAFSGGSAAADAGGATVKIIPHETTTLGFGALVVLIVMLVGFMFMLSGRGHSPAAEKEVLEIQKEELLNQLARLDDLQRAGAVSDAMYKLKRGELLNALAGIYYHTTFDKQTAQPEDTRTKGAARVPD